jgi:hypothetical protein
MQDVLILTRALRLADCHRCDGVLLRTDICRDNCVSSVSSLPLSRVLCLACKVSLVKARSRFILSKPVLSFLPSHSFLSECVLTPVFSLPLIFSFFYFNRFTCPLHFMYYYIQQFRLEQFSRSSIHYNLQ